MDVQFVVFCFLFVIGGGLYLFSKNQKEKAEIEKIKLLPLEEKKLQLMKLQTKISQYNTSHVLHFLISICTIGFWIVIWFLVAQSNASKRNDINRLIDSF